MSNFPKELEMLPSLPSSESEKSKIKSNSQSCKLLSSLNLSTVSNHKNMMMRLDRRRQEFGLRAKSLSEGAPFVSYRLPLASYPLIEPPSLWVGLAGVKTRSQNRAAYPVAYRPAYPATTSSVPCFQSFQSIKGFEGLQELQVNHMLIT